MPSSPWRALTWRYAYHDLGAGFVYPSAAQALESPSLVAFNVPLAKQLGLHPCQLTRTEIAQIFAGMQFPPEMRPVACKYAGHQFGIYNPDLGDGRGLLLGELLDTKQQAWELHLKGSGLTPFSRFGDGRAVLRSCLREYLASLALPALGIPSTQALALCQSKTWVAREGLEPAATLVRVSQSHLRFGHFEHFYHQRQWDQLQNLYHFALHHYFTPIDSTQVSWDQALLALFTEVIRRTARLIAHWQVYGFVHGVMNTDNMSLLGETLDFGPYAFMQTYQEAYVSNCSDTRGRYAYAHQPDIGYWNLACLGQTLTPWLSESLLREALDTYWSVFDQAYYQHWAQRLGGLDVNTDVEKLITHLVKVMQQDAVRGQPFAWQQALAALARGQEEAFLAFSNHAPEYKAWLQQYYALCQAQGKSPAQIQACAQKHNPLYLLYPWVCAPVIEAAEQGEFEPLHQLIALIQNPYQAHPQGQSYQGDAPAWAEHLHLSCSS